MGIEGGSNSEVQNQEINQANNEQNEINQAEHQRSGEELEGNSTIDNEGERKQIEGKDDATESAEDESSQLDNQDSTEGDIQDSLDAEDSIDSDDTDDSVEEDDNNEQDPLDSEDSIEDDGEEESESPEGEEETENPEGGEESETLEEETENPEESGESEGLEGKEDIENPEKDIDVEPTLDNKLDDIKDAAYEGRDAEGNMTPEAKEKLVDDMKQAYDDTPKEDRGDTLVPEKSEYLKDPPIAENKNTGERYNDVNYDWPSNGGFEGKPEEVAPQVGDRFDRVGAENGRYVAPIEGDTPQPVENRGLPYHFTEDNITDEPSYHSYEVDRDFGQLQDAINEYNNPALTAEENEFMRGEFQKEYDRNNWPSDEYTHEPGKTYYGDIAEAFDSGGGTQLELPMSVESLKELGMIHEV